MLAVVLSLLLSACAAQPPVPPAEGTALKQKESRLQQLRVLLYRAQLALSQDRLRYPAGNNAHAWYQQVLALDASNAEAHWGMQQISARYLALAEKAFLSDDPARAEVFLHRALQVAATPAQLNELRQRYRHRALPANQFTLSIKDLSARNQQIKKELAVLAERARKTGSRLLIVARNDAEGRWIYQYMRSAVAGYRLRGNINIGSQPKVTLIDLGG